MYYSRSRNWSDADEFILEEIETIAQRNNYRVIEDENKLDGMIVYLTVYLQRN